MRSRRALLILAPLLAYASSLQNGFVWDDHKVIERGQLIGSLRNLPSLFAHDAMYNSDGGAFAARARVDTYRPLPLATFFLERAAFGLRPALFHLDSALIHAANVVLLDAVGVVLGLSPTAAMTGALLFGVHPAVSEAVHWVNGRSDPLCVLFILLGILAWKRNAAPLVILCAFAATLSKETAFVLIPCLILLRRSNFWPWAVGLALGFGARLLALHDLKASGGGAHLAYAIARLPSLWLDGLISLALPVGQAPPSLFDRYRSPSIAMTIIAIAIIVALAALAAWRFRRGRPLAAWALAGYLAAMAPVALLTFNEGWTGWGRYLYPALPALALWAASALVDGALPRLREGVRQFAAGAVAVALLACAAQTLAAGRDWRDDRSFARALMVDHPESSLGYSELAVVELNEGHSAQALALLEKALAINPARAQNWSRAATALMQLGRRPEAFAAAAHALERDPEDNNARYVTAIRLLGERRAEEAAALLVDVVRTEPAQEGAWNTLAQAVKHAPGFAARVAALAEEPRNRPVAPRLRALAK